MQLTGRKEKKARWLQRSKKQQVRKKVQFPGLEHQSKQRKKSNVPRSWQNNFWWKRLPEKKKKKKVPQLRNLKEQRAELASETAAATETKRGDVVPSTNPRPDTDDPTADDETPKEEGSLNYYKLGSGF